MLDFELSKLPRIVFGNGSVCRLAEFISPIGKRCLLVTGGSSWSRTEWWQPLTHSLDQASLSWTQVTVGGEPSPELVDNVVKEFGPSKIDAVVGIGGGSAMDAAKAIAGLLRVGDSVMDYLEGVGPEKAYQGPAVPFIAVPTTAGTGSEATKNAVLSRIGEGGFKKSFRDEQLMAEIAIVDPDLLASCPRSVIAANGMDALTQLIESYVSLRQNPFCNTLAEQAIRCVRDGLIPLYTSNGDDPDARANMAFASLVSGINLAQTGLGSVHGLASPLGAYFPIPHGVACGSLLANATRLNIEALQQREPESPFLERYRKVGQMLCGCHFPDQELAFTGLLGLLEKWTAQLGIQGLSEYGVVESDIPGLVANISPSSMRTNPVKLIEKELHRLLLHRL